MRTVLVWIVLLYLRFIAQIQLLKTHPKIIGVGGSSGKSSLVGLIAAVLSSKYTVKQSQGKNSETGLPLDILGIHMKDFSFLAWLAVIIRIPFSLLFNWEKYDIYVAEMGIDSPVEPKNMSYLLNIIKPTVGIVTNVSLEHSVYFEPYVDEVNPIFKAQKILDLTAAQETLLLNSMPDDGYAVINIDDEKIRQIIPQVHSKKITVSLSQDADVVGKDISNSSSHFSMIISHEGKNYPLTIGQPLPHHFAYEFLFACAAGLTQDIDIQSSIVSIQQHFTLPPGRLSFFAGIKDTLLVDSTYNNATLPPVIDILDLIKEIGPNRRKVAILGDMRELGEEAQDIHEQVARKILNTVDLVILIGPLSEKYMVPIIKAGQFPFENFPDVTSCKKALLNLIQPNDLILVKGSQNTLFLERIVEDLLADKKDIDKLTRRGSFWDTKRSKVL